MRQQLIPRSSLAALLCALGLVAIVGAPCPIPIDESECDDNHDCDDDEECNSGHCDEADGEGEGAEGEGEGEGEGGGEGEGEGGGPSQAQLTAYCTHVSDCLAEQGSEFPPDDCIAQGTAELEQTAGDPTCAQYNAALVPLVICGASAPCASFNDGTFCPDELAAVEDVRATCETLNGG